MTKKCSSSGRTVEDQDGIELTDGRFFCQSGGCQSRFLTGVYEKEVKPNLMAQNEAMTTPTETAVCDTCSTKIVHPEGYLLTTRQVVSTPAYWQHYYHTHQGEFSGLGVHSYADFYTNPLLRPAVIQTVAGQRTPWIVCGNCVKMFAVDQNLMHEYAEKWGRDKNFQPPGTGAASTMDVNMGSGVRLPDSGKPATPLDFLEPQKKKWQFWKK